MFKKIIIIIIMSRHQYGYPWPSLATPPYRPLLPTGLQDYIPYRHRAALCRFLLVILPLLVHGKGSTGVHYLWARPYFSSSVKKLNKLHKIIYIYINICMYMYSPTPSHKQDVTQGQFLCRVPTHGRAKAG